MVKRKQVLFWPGPPHFYDRCARLDYSILYTHTGLKISKQKFSIVRMKILSTLESLDLGLTFMVKAHHLKASH